MDATTAERDNKVGHFVQWLWYCAKIWITAYETKGNIIAVFRPLIITMGRNKENDSVLRVALPSSPNAFCSKRYQIE